MMKWYFKNFGTHTRVSVFVNGEHRGYMCFPNEEFDAIARTMPEEVALIVKDE